MYMVPANGCKNYWSWVCDCGFDDNRNTDRVCKSCGKRINCETSGGHSFYYRDAVPQNGRMVAPCSGGCGLERDMGPAR